MDPRLINQLMRHAIRLAQKTPLSPSPNPRVGALLVSPVGEIIASGYHRTAGCDHAEIVVLKSAGKLSGDETLVVTLEPCCHHGKTPPCIDAIIRSGVRKVVVGCIDPNPAVQGRGILELRRAGVNVTLGIEEARCIELNAGFITRHVANRPFFSLKEAATLDGRVFAHGLRKITDVHADRLVHRWRREHDAVLVGIATVLADNPQLTVRFASRNRPQPARVILDSAARTPPSARVVTAHESRCLIAVGPRAPARRIASLEKAGASVLHCRVRRGRIDLDDLLNRLLDQNLYSIMIEGGPRVTQSFLAAGLVDRIDLLFSPRLSGICRGAKTILPLDHGPSFVTALLAELSLKTVGVDIWIGGYIPDSKFYRYLIDAPRQSASPQYRPQVADKIRETASP